MGVSVEQGKGRGKNQNVDLNLVPFIDFMSCLIAFLMIAAVWTQIASLDVDQRVSNDIIDDFEVNPIPPLTIHLRADGLFVARKVEEGKNLPRTGEAQDLAGLEGLLAADHAQLPTEDMVIINTDDGVPYGEMAAVLDLSRKHGYQRTMLAGGPAAL